MVSLALDSSQLAETYDRVGTRQLEHGKELVSALKLRPGERVLDVGCGTGLLTLHLAKLVGPSGKVDGVDPLPLRIALAKRRAPANLTLAVGRAEELSSYADGSFDVVVLNSVLHWLPEKLGPLREALRVLRPGGRIGISTAIADVPHDFERILKQVFASSDLADAERVPSGTTHKVTSGAVEAVLREAGFVDVRLEVRTFVDHFEDTEAVFTFNQASSFGNFLSSLSHEQRALAHNLLERELEQRRDGEGLRLERHLAFVIAERAR